MQFAYQYGTLFAEPQVPRESRRHKSLDRSIKMWRIFQIAVQKSFCNTYAMAMNGNRSAEVNASGHVQELERQFGLLSLSAVGIVTGCSWALMGGTIVSPRTCPAGLRESTFLTEQI